VTKSNQVAPLRADGIQTVEKGATQIKRLIFIFFSMFKEMPCFDAFPQKKTSTSPKGCLEEQITAQGFN